MLLQTYIGLSADVQARTMTIAPHRTVGAISVSGLRVADSALDIAVTADGSALIAKTDADIEIVRRLS